MKRDSVEISARCVAEQQEVEELIRYPHVAKRLQKHGLHHISGYEPSKVPKEQI